MLISGGGTNLQSIIDACEVGSLSCKITLVISNQKDAFGLERARDHGIPREIVDHRNFGSREDFEGELIRLIDKSGADLICLAGFMRVLSPHFVGYYKHRLMNIHPALLPAFPGIHGKKDAIEYGVRFSGATVHFVDEGTDTGPIIIQAVVPVYQSDTEEVLGARILVQEHRIYPLAIKYFFEGRLEIIGRKVVYKSDREIEEFASINPAGP